jgi:hypothetical protein
MIRKKPPLTMPILNIWYEWSPTSVWQWLFWIYDMDEAIPPSPSLTTPIINIW